MKSQGIRIFDRKNKFGRIEFTEILMEIKNGDLFYWSSLFLEVIGSLGEGISVPLFANNIRESTNGLIIDWKDLNALANKFEELINIKLLGSKNKNLLKRYDDDQEMYESCDIVIELIDSAFWEVFSNDQHYIKRLAEKFKQTEFLETNFQDGFF